MSRIGQSMHQPIRPAQYAGSKRQLKHSERPESNQYPNTIRSETNHHFNTKLNKTPKSTPHEKLQTIIINRLQTKPLKGKIVNIPQTTGEESFQDNCSTQRLNSQTNCRVPPAPWALILSEEEVKKSLGCASANTRQDNHFSASVSSPQ